MLPVNNDLHIATDGAGSTTPDYMLFRFNGAEGGEYTTSVANTPRVGMHGTYRSYDLRLESFGAAF